MSESTADSEFNRRPIIGLLSIGLLIAAAFLLLVRGGNDLVLGSACLRVGLLLGAVWLAYPQVSRIPPWMFGTILVSLMSVSYTHLTLPTTPYV